MVKDTTMDMDIKNKDIMNKDTVMTDTDHSRDGSLDRHGGDRSKVYMNLHKTMDGDMTTMTQDMIVVLVKCISSRDTRTRCLST